MVKSQATSKARRQSNNKSNIGINRVVAFSGTGSDRNFIKGEWYTQEIGIDRSFNLAGKENVINYISGKRTE